MGCCSFFAIDRADIPPPGDTAVDIGALSTWGATSTWIRQQLSIAGSHIVAWLKEASKEISLAFTSVSGLSMMLYMAESINLLAQQIINYFPQNGTQFKPFNKSEFDKVVWATRIFTDPHYYLGGAFEKERQEGRIFAIAAAVLGTIWNAGMFALWLSEQGCAWISQLASRISQNFSFSWTRFISAEMLLSGICITSYSCMFVERMREIVDGKHLLFSFVDAASELLEAISGVFSVLPVTMSLPLAILQVVSASLGMMSFFLDPGGTV
jgi:hypothetical protein